MYRTPKSFNKPAICVYAIINKTLGLTYIGSTKAFYYRCSFHQSRLKYNTHENKKLIQLYNNDPVREHWDFIVLEDCSTHPENLHEREVFYISALKPECNVYSRK